MKEVRGEHPRDPGKEIRIKPYYDFEVSRQRLTAQGKWEKVADHKDAVIRVTGAQGLIKGQRASLAIPRDEDPEVGGYFDCDGTRSREFVEMTVAELIVLEGGMIVEGFVTLGDWYNNHPQAFEFAYERWDQAVRKQKKKK